MAEYINRNSIYNKLQALFNYWLNSIESQTISISYAKQRILPMIMEELPASDVAPVVHGRWIMHDDELGLTCECSVCHIETMCDGNYCPNCGARMDIQDRGDNDAKSM